ncbi:MAG: Asp-tRNA(Asn)/Glu-tRNA(Gln) amidotransferase GatCAB subunit A [Bacillaceae bacterium]|nr:Asp-tRNA(Asn)/Glu-tRNA(Gln) amidotransferase GatCAB subunit A [Bacillaceae bacterium]
MTDLYSLTATELGPLLESKQISPTELTHSILERINAVDSTVNAYITTLPELALQQAAHAEKEIMNGLYKGPLHGIPIGIKDNYYTKGIRTTAGSKILSDFIPDETATAVEKLMAAGGVMLGKLNMHEFGGGITNTNPVYGNVRNPWKVNYSPGGSSGGSGAALAAGLATLATGTDTFGSIRVPASMCGVYGLKPTYGLVSTKGVAPLAWSLDHAGPMARSVSDLALMLNVMAGYDPKDPGSIKARIPDYTENLNKGINGLKIGVPSYYMQGLDRDVEILFKDAVKTLETMGATVVDVDIPELSMSAFAGYVITIGEASTYHYEWLQTRSEEYADDVRIFFKTGVLTNSPHYVRSQQVRRVLTEALKKTYEDVDVLIGPTIPITTPAFQKNWVEQNLEVTRRGMPFTSPPNLTGAPSLSVPIGLCSEGLPVGMQLIGNHFTEKRLLQVGSEWEKVSPLSRTVHS